MDLLECTGTQILIVDLLKIDKIIRFKHSFVMDESILSHFV